MKKLILTLVLSAVTTLGPGSVFAGPSNLPVLFQNLSGTGHSTMVLLQNFSPYDIVLDTTNPTAMGQLKDLRNDMDFGTPSIFVPNGVPTFLPRTIYAVDGSTPVASPLASMLFVYQDAVMGKNIVVPDQLLTYTIQGVQPSTSTPKEDVPLFIELLRQKPVSPQTSPLDTKAILNIIKTTVDIVQAAATGKGWPKLVFAITGDIYNIDKFAAGNTFSGSQNINISAYVSVPDQPGGCCGASCSPWTSCCIPGGGTNTDSMSLQIPPDCGTPGAQDIVVTIVTFRGSYGTDQGSSGNDILPYTLISVYDYAHYEAAKATSAMTANTLSASLTAKPEVAAFAGLFQNKRQGFYNILKALKTMPRDQRSQLDGALDNINRGKSLTQEQLSALADATAAVNAL